MHIWIFNPYEPLPFEGEIRLRYASLAEQLVLLGHSVTWWSADWSHALKRKRSLPLESANVEKWESAEESQSKPSGLPTFRPSGHNAFRVICIPVPPYKKNISLRRVWSHSRYAKGIEQCA